MIDIRKLKELVRLMVENDLSELDLQDQQETVTIKRGGSLGVTPVASLASTGVSSQTQPLPPAVPSPAPSPETQDPGTTDRAVPTEEGLHVIRSPMVGTVYLSPNPESPPYVTVGSHVDPKTTVCLIEAMKVFSEIHAECTGTIEKVLVQSGQAVQYNQPLFLVRLD